MLTRRSGKNWVYSVYRRYAHSWCFFLAVSREIMRSPLSESTCRTGFCCKTIALFVRFLQHMLHLFALLSSCIRLRHSDMHYSVCVSIFRCQVGDETETISYMQILLFFKNKRRGGNSSSNNKKTIKRGIRWTATRLRDWFCFKAR